MHIFRSVASVDFAEGLCCRIHRYKASLTREPQSYTGLYGQEWSKLRGRLEKTFPDFGDLSKVEYWLISISRNYFLFVVDTRL